MLPRKIVSTLFVLLVVSALLLVTAERANAATTTYMYDAAGRLIRVDYGLGKGFAFEYDNNGNLIKRTTLAATTTTRRRAVRSASNTTPNERSDVAATNLRAKGPTE